MPNLYKQEAARGSALRHHRQLTGRCVRQAGRCQGRRGARSGCSIYNRVIHLHQYYAPNANQHSKDYPPPEKINFIAYIFAF